MAGRLIWSPRSLAELDDIADYIAKDSPIYARMVVGQVIDRAELLPDMPDPAHPGYNSFDELFAALNAQQGRDPSPQSA